ERDVLLLCAAVEFDGAFAARCATAQGDPARPYATFALALAALPNAHWSALTPDAPLRRWLLVELGNAAPGTPLTCMPLRIDERVLHYLAGLVHPDERLAALLAPLSGRGLDTLIPAHQSLAERVSSVFGVFGGAERATPAVVQLCGSESSAK